MSAIIVTAPVFFFAVGTLFGQLPVRSRDTVMPYYQLSTPDARDIIFSNLNGSPDNLYSSAAGFEVAGKNATSITESWIGIWFIPKADVRAKELMAAIGYVSGTKLVNLGLYSHNTATGSVGDPLPGGQGSTTQIPDAGTCCQMAKVTLAGSGVALTAGTTYWLVATSDDVNAPTFSGTWQQSYSARSAYMYAGFPWTTYPGQWPAAEIRGTNLSRLVLRRQDVLAPLSKEANASDASVTLFTNLGPSSTDLYDSYNGAPLRGNNVPDQQENWEAVPFTVKRNSHAKTLTAAVGYISGTKKVNLGVYSDSGGTVGTVLPGGQGSTIKIPDSGDCCQLTKVTLPGAGVALTAATQYWLVASTDDANAPDFNGLWHESNLAVTAYTEPENFISWTSFSGLWHAAAIRGTSP